MREKRGQALKEKEEEAKEEQGCNSIHSRKEIPQLIIAMRSS